MIMDKLDNISAYKGISGSLDLAIEYLKQNKLDMLPPGRSPIDGDRVFVTLMTSQLGQNPAWEIHRKYIDIQIALTQGESIAWAPHDTICGFSPYDESKGDIQLSLDPRDGLICPLPQGWFFIFFPTDAHRPGIGQGSARKAVVKVAAS